MQDTTHTPIPKWFERTFAFSLSPELLPNVCSRLRGTPARLEEQLRTADPSLLIKKPDLAQGRWSALEHAGHLLDLEALWLARVDDFVTGRDGLTPTDLGNRSTDQANHNATAPEQILAQFRRARWQLLARVSELDDSVQRRAITHPRLQTPMRLIDHLQFVAEHDDHHLARIWQLTQAPK